MKKIIMMLQTLNVVGLTAFNLTACSPDNGNKIEISYTDPSASTPESKQAILVQIIHPLLQTLNIPDIKFSNGTKWTQTQFNNSLELQKEILKSNVKADIWADFFKTYLTTEDYTFNKVEIPWKLENTGSLNEDGKKEKKTAVVSELNPIIDHLNDEMHEDYVKTITAYEKANNFALVKLNNSPYIVTFFYKKEFKFNVELKNLTAFLARLKYKENNDEKWEWFFSGYYFRKYDIFPTSKNYIVTKNLNLDLSVLPNVGLPGLFRPTLSEFNFPYADLEFNIIGDSIEKIN